MRGTFSMESRSEIKESEELNCSSVGEIEVLGDSDLDELSNESAS